MIEDGSGTGFTPRCRYVRATLAAGFLALLGAVPAVACPVCDTGTGEQVRQGIFDERFGLNLALTLAPFPIFLAVAALLYYGFPAGRRRGTPPSGDR